MARASHGAGSGAAAGYGVAPSAVVPTGRDATWRKLDDRVRGLVYSQVEDELRGRRYAASAAQEMATMVSERCMMQVSCPSG